MAGILRAFRDKRRWSACGASLCIAIAAPASAAVRMFTYDPADDTTRHISGSLTFRFQQRLTSIRVLRVMATEGDAAAALQPTGEGTLGRGGLGRALGRGSQERDLYTISGSDQGAAMIAAFCPGAHQGWMVFGRLRANHDLTVLVLSDAKGAPSLCQTLKFSFRGEWKLPPGTRIDPNQFDPPSLAN